MFLADCVRCSVIGDNSVVMCDLFIVLRLFDLLYTLIVIICLLLGLLGCLCECVVVLCYW